MPDKLPKELGQEPLIDALFEVRFHEVSAPLADILPGFLISKLGEAPLSRLPASDIPKMFRATDPALMFAPTQRLDWGKYMISLGEKNIIINCKMPYPKWENFKKAILDTISYVGELKGLQGKVERFSLKYTNLLKAENNSEQTSKINMAIRVGNIDVSDEETSLTVHRKEEGLLHIITVAIGAKAQWLDKPPEHGAILSLDTIKWIDPNSSYDFSKIIGTELESLKQANKRLFFSMLTGAAIDEMEPKYE